MHVETGSVSTCTTDFVVRVDKKLWVGSGLFKNCNSLFTTQGTVFGNKSFDHTDWVALPDDASGHSSTLVGWGWICIMELPGCKLLSKRIRFLAKFDNLLDFVEMLLHSSFEFLLCVSHVCFSCVVAFEFVDCH